jgi:hypothetical protein
MDRTPDLALALQGRDDVVVAPHRQEGASALWAWSPHRCRVSSRYRATLPASRIPARAASGCCVGNWAAFSKKVSAVSPVQMCDTHVDQYRGVKRVVHQADVASGKVAIIAPGTIARSTSPPSGDLIAGNTMSRRAMYALANLIDREPHSSSPSAPHRSR